VDEYDRLPPRRLTIGELAGLAGVSTRTVRHYHAVGLLPEPERDTSGYRRYGPGDVINLVRIVRLRAVGMPIPRIASQLTDPATASHDLGALAAELSEEIARLTALRDRLVTMAERGGPGPADSLAIALRDAGRLAADRPLAPVEAAAVELVDALHPAGVAGIVDAMGPVLADRARADRLAELVQRVQHLPDAADDQQLDQLVDELVAVLPTSAPRPVPVQLAVLEKLLGHRLSDAQRRFQQRMRAALDPGA
jgi:DNA-binding transcriptional MerR regulator